MSQLPNTLPTVSSDNLTRIANSLMSTKLQSPNMIGLTPDNVRVMMQDTQNARGQLNQSVDNALNRGMRQDEQQFASAMQLAQERRAIRDQTLSEQYRAATLAMQARSQDLQREGMRLQERGLDQQAAFQQNQLSAQQTAAANADAYKMMMLDETASQRRQAMETTRKAARQAALQDNTQFVAIGPDGQPKVINMLEASTLTESGAPYTLQPLPDNTAAIELVRQGLDVQDAVTLTDAKYGLAAIAQETFKEMMADRMGRPLTLEDLNVMTNATLAQMGGLLSPTGLQYAQQQLTGLLEMLNKTQTQQQPTPTGGSSGLTPEERDALIEAAKQYRGATP